MPIPQLHNSDWREQRNSHHSSQSRSPQKRFWSNFFGKIIRFFLVLIFLGFIGGAIAGGILFLRLSQSVPNPNSLIEREIPQSTQIFDKTGKTILYEVHGDEKRTLITIDKVPLTLKNATIAIEDKDFYKHGGFSLWSMFRSLVKNVFTGSKVGGSTITQQLIKNSILTTEKTYTRKIKEVILSYKVEKQFSKDEILQMYFNEIPYGSNAYGAEAASQKYFGRSAQDIDLAESSILAAMVQAPSKYSPYGNNTETLFARQKYILDLMVEQGYITEDQAKAAKEEKITFKAPSENIIAPHFVMYVKDQLIQKYGEQAVERGGLKIYTTLDIEKQKIAEEAIQAHKETINKQGATNAALVSIDPKTGQILAMVGSLDFFNQDIDGQVNIVTSLRQPGSSIKPLVYAAAINKGYTPDTILYDVNTQFNANTKDTDSNDKKYEPHNYDNKERGPITMRIALSNSLNISAVKTLYLVGVKNVTNLAHEMGYTTLNDPDRYGLSLVLGGGEVKMLEHANAFGAFAREGELHKINSILKIEDKNGKVLEEYKDEKKQVLEVQTARAINSILSDNTARSLVFGPRSWLYIKERAKGIGVKTGTTNDYRDAWTIGYSPSIVTAVWVGNSDNSKMNKGADGSKIAAPIWNDFMVNTLKETPVEEFKPYESVKTGKNVLDGVKEELQTIKVDKSSGLLATEFTPESMTEEKVFYSPHSILHYVKKDDPRGDVPEKPEEDPQYTAWEDGIKDWIKRNQEDLLKKLKEEKKKAGEDISKISTSTISFDAPPTEKDNVHLEENKPKFSIASPQNNQNITNAIFTASIENATAPRGINRAEYYIDGQLFLTNASFPYNLEKDISTISNGDHLLKISACDDVDNCSSQEVNFSLSLEQAANSIQEQDKALIELTYPPHGIALSSADFPLTLKAFIQNPSDASKIIFYASTRDGGSENIGEITSNSNNEQEIIHAWNGPGKSGDYEIHAEAILKNGEIIKSKAVTLIITY